MDIQKELLLFLYKEKDSLKLVSINNIFTDKNLTDLGIRSLIKELKKKEIIETDYNHTNLGNGNPPTTISNAIIKARLTPVVGLKFVIDTYLQNKDTSSIINNQVLHFWGNNNAPISQANVHSDSIASQSIDTERKKRATVIQIIKYVSLILSPIAAAIGIYQFFIK